MNDETTLQTDAAVAEPANDTVMPVQEPLQPDNRTQKDAFDAAMRRVKSIRESLLLQLAGNQNTTTIVAWMAERDTVLAYQVGKATEKQIALMQGIADAGNETLEQYVAKVVKKAEYLSQDIMLTAAALVRRAEKAIETVYAQAQSMDQAAGVAAIDAALAAAIAEAYGAASNAVAA